MSLIRATIIGTEATQGRNVVALGLTQALSQNYKTAVFRPTASHDDPFTQQLISASNIAISEKQAVGMCPCRARTDKEGARADIVAAFSDTIQQSDAQACVIIASDTTPIFDPEQFTFDANVAADLASPVILVVSARNRDAHQILATIDAAKTCVQHAGTTTIAVAVTECTEALRSELETTYQDTKTVLWALPTLENADNQQAYEAFSAVVTVESLAEVLAQPFEAPTTPYAFQYSLLGKAKADKKTIVLPEGEEDRIIKAADYLLERDIVNLIIVGERESILKRAEELNLRSLQKATFQSMNDETVLLPMVEKLCELRAKKGMTAEQARAQLQDASYFGTMLVVLGKADGLVSGSVNSTANTVRPALQVIKTNPGASLVSGAFLMCFKDHVAVFADCAINTNPNAQQLADIALQSAETAAAFGIKPKVGMLSYSTLGSGKGPDVDLVEEATAIVKQSDPNLDVVGSIQFDAAWSPTVAAAKAKGNDIAGHVNVFVFPDLCAGNIAYKAVQRSSGALAVGPILQGLNRPVNDLSRGALVQDIINTVALTAIEAQH